MSKWILICLNYSLLGWTGLVVTIALVTCGMLCKEQGITVVGICLIYDLCIVNKVRVISSIYILGICYLNNHVIPPAPRRTSVDNTHDPMAFDVSFLEAV